MPAGLSGLSPRVEVVTSAAYRNPASLPPGGVLVVGASASGVQIADELTSAGREVVLAVGRHIRMPRRYRGRDVFWWLEATGRLARTIDDAPDGDAARRENSLQRIGRQDPQVRDRDLDLRSLHERAPRGTDASRPSLSREVWAAVWAALGDCEARPATMVSTAASAP